MTPSTFRRFTTKAFSLAGTAVLACVLAAPNSQAQRVSLSSMDAKIDGVQATLDQGPVPVTSCGTIDQPGSYVLVNNLTSSPPGTCLLVKATYVTIDLAGFRIDCGGSGNGVFDDDSLRFGIAVRNGVITRCDNGIQLSRTRDALVERVRAILNIGDGIRLGAGAVALANVSNSNGGFGLRVAAGSTVSRNTAILNDATGIVAGAGSTVTENTVSNNGNDGISFLGGSTITGNTSRANEDDGIISSSDGNTISGNTSSNNKGVGIGLRCPSNVFGNAATGNTVANAILFVPAGAAACNNTNNLAP